MIRTEQKKESKKKRTFPIDSRRFIKIGDQKRRKGGKKYTITG